MIGLLLAVAAVGLPPGYEWHDFGDGSQQYALMRRGEQVGGYNAATGVYRSYNASRGEWGERQECPCDPPVKNFGLTAEKRPAHRFTYNGHEVSEEEAFAALRDAPKPAPCPADSKKLRVVVIGGDADTGRVKSAWDSDNALSAFKDSMLFQSYHPDDWQVAEYGFVTSGRPTIYCLAPDGTVLHRQDDFEGGAGALSEALRQADASYNGTQDVDRRNAMDSVFAFVKKIPPAVGLLGAIAVVGGLLLLWKGKK